MLRDDGACPACGRAQTKAGEKPGGEAASEVVPLEVGLASVQVFAKLMAPPPGPPVLPDRCACCGAPASGRTTEVPIDARSFFALPSCEACDLHLRPSRMAALTPVALTFGGGAAFWAKASPHSTIAAITFGAGALLLVVALVADRRSRTPRPLWNGAREGHCGPLLIMRVGGNHVFSSQHRSWLREVEQLTRDEFDTKLEIKPPAAA